MSETIAYPVKETRYGFEWGPASVVRTMSTSTHGVVIGITTARGTAYVRVTPSGLIRLPTKVDVIP